MIESSYLFPKISDLAPEELKVLLGGGHEMSKYHPMDSHPPPPRDRPIFVVNADDPKTIPASVFWRNKTNTDPEGWYLCHAPLKYQGLPTHWTELNWVNS